MMQGVVRVKKYDPCIAIHHIAILLYSALQVGRHRKYQQML